MLVLRLKHLLFSYNTTRRVLKKGSKLVNKCMPQCKGSESLSLKYYRSNRSAQGCQVCGLTCK